MFIGLGLNSIDKKNAFLLFNEKTYIFLLIDRPFGAEGLPDEYRGRWYARNQNSVGFYLPLSRKSEVTDAIRKLKSIFITK